MQVWITEKLSMFFSPQPLPEEAEFAHTGLQWQGPLLSALHLAELCYHPVYYQEQRKKSWLGLLCHPCFSSDQNQMPLKESNFNI